MAFNPIGIDKAKEFGLGLRPNDKVRRDWCARMSPLAGNNEAFQTRKSMDMGQIGMPKINQLQKSKAGE